MNKELRIMVARNKLKSIIHDSLFMIRKHKGFTLIELLVAIAIIGILSSFLLANFVGVRQRSRDGVRKSDLRQIQSALELYRADQAKYPSSLPGCRSPLAAGGTTYMQKIPCDPSSGSVYGYGSQSSNSTYCVRGCLENDKDGDRDELSTKFGKNNPTTGACSSVALSCSGKSYSLQNP